MKKIVKIKVVAIITFFAIMSCTESTPLGLWSDNIKLSQKEVNFTSESSSILITTQGDWWWIDRILFNKTIIDFSDINTTQHNFIIETSDFKIERRNTTEIYILMSENTTETKRVLQIGLQAGDYFDAINVTQLSN